MKKLLLPALMLTCLSFTAFNNAEARSSYNSNTIGGITYHNGSIGGESFRGTSNTIGGITYHNGSIGGESFRGTSNTIGGITYHNFR